MGTYYFLLSLTSKWFLIFNHWKTRSNYSDYLLMLKVRQRLIGVH